MHKVQGPYALDPKLPVLVHRPPTAKAETDIFRFVEALQTYTRNAINILSETLNLSRLGMGSATTQPCCLKAVAAGILALQLPETRWGAFPVT